MDKYEYKIKSEEIKELITQKEYARAAEIADTIDWRRVKSVMMLCTISDLYKINRRYEDSRDLLLLAYDRHPGGRTIVYALCELSIKMGEIPQAVEYCKEFVNIAPRDSGRYILQYKIYEAQGVALEERIEVLEELKKYDYREKWAYELAYLYHRIGLASKCVDECDEMIVWFGDGRYVIKAMELKMLHQSLTPEQQYKYNRRFAPAEEEIVTEDSVKEEATVVEEAPSEIVTEQTGYEEERGSTTVWSARDVAASMEPLGVEEAETKKFPVEEINIQVQTMDPSNQYNTINLQAELAAGLKEILEKDAKRQQDEITRTIMEPMMHTDNLRREDATKVLPITHIKEKAEMTPEETGEILEEATLVWKKEEVISREIPMEEEVYQALLEKDTGEMPGAMVKSLEQETEEVSGVLEEISREESALEEVTPIEEASTGQQIMEQMRREAVEPPKEMAKVLSMEADGQISFLVEEKNAVEQQITGQLSIADIMAEWERMKKELEEKGKEKVRQHVKQNTGPMFTEFEASVRDGLLEQLEGGRTMESVIAEAEGSPEEEELPVPESLKEEEAVFSEKDNVVAFEQVEVESRVRNSRLANTTKKELVFAPVEEISIEEDILTSEDTVEELTEIEDSPSLEEPVLMEQDALVESLEMTEEEFVMEMDNWNESEDMAEVVAEIESVEEDLPDELMAAEEQVEEAEDPFGEFGDVFFEEDEEIEEADNEEVAEAEFGKGTKARSLTKEERELFGPYLQGRSSKEQLVQVIDNISMAAYTGNVIVTGAEGLDTLGLAKSIVKEIQMTDRNFSGKSAKISGEALNRRKVKELLDGLQNGAFIIQRAYNMNDKTVNELYKALQQENRGIVVVLEGVKKSMDAFLEKNGRLKNVFTARIDMEALSDAALVAYCKKYARENEFVMDEMAVLALHQIITDRQTNDHAVTIMEVREIMDDAMDSAGRKSIGHFFDILMAKRYDEEDMIIIHEKDLM